MNLRIRFLIVAVLSCCFSSSFSQDALPNFRWDERNLTLTDGTSIVEDLTAHDRSAIYRSASTAGNTIWFGPYKQIQPGNYLVQFRLKVGSNQSSSLLFTADVVSSSGGYYYGSIDIKPNMFRNNNEWQLFTMPVQIIGNINDFEIRGISFQTGVTDVFLDYIILVPGDARGFYSKDFTVTGNGNVSIGIADPKEYRLAVNGNVRAHSIKVETQNWPDYVFTKDYKLLGLSEIEQFIAKNGHLPGIPSAVQIKKDGVNLGEMNAKLLEKIEELTLHLIEMEKNNAQVQSLYLKQAELIKQQQQDILTLKSNIK